MSRTNVFIRKFPWRRLHLLKTLSDPLELLPGVSKDSLARVVTLLPEQNATKICSLVVNCA